MASDYSHDNKQSRRVRTSSVRTHHSVYLDQFFRRIEEDGLDG